jgi:S-methylmethionine-dependent homocysteine/selenocysteine methylase
VGLEARAAELTALAARLAREGAHEAGTRGALVLGSAPPLEDCYAPQLVPDDASLAREHEEHARNLVAAGVDAILVETMNCAREAEAALRAAREAGAPALVSFVCAEDARLPSGEPAAEAIARVLPLGPLAVGVNCAPWATLAPWLQLLRSANAPFLAYANLGAPLEGDARTHEQSPNAESAGPWFEAGGCCGTRPEHIAALAARVANTRTRADGRSALE